MGRRRSELTIFPMDTRDDMPGVLLPRETQFYSNN